MEPLDRWLSLLPYAGSLVAGWLMYRAARKQTDASSQSTFNDSLITQNQNLEAKVSRLEQDQVRDHADLRRLGFAVEAATAENRKLALQLQLAIVWGQTVEGAAPRDIPAWLLTGPKKELDS